MWRRGFLRWKVLLVHPFPVTSDDPQISQQLLLIGARRIAAQRVVLGQDVDGLREDRHAAHGGIATMQLQRR